MIECIIFDCDGTLVDSEKLSSKALLLELKEYQIFPEINFLVSKYKGMKLSEIIKSLENTYSVSFRNNFEKNFRRKMNELFEQSLEPVPGVPNLLCQLKIPFCVASNGPKKKTEKSLKITKLLPYFSEKIFSGYDIDSWKPDPDIFLYAADKMRVHPENCVVVEDSIPGIIAANSANMKTFFYDGEGNSIVPEECKYTKINEMMELLKYF